MKIWFLVILLAAGLRFLGTANNNQGFYVDEASLAYNAVSLWETGKDEYGQAFPLAWRSFGDYKSPLFIYLAAPLVRLTGPVLGVRLLSALAGIATVILVGLAAGLMAPAHKEWARLGASLFLAVLPWQLNLSRHGIEAVLGTAFLALAWWLFLRGNWRGSLVGLAVAALTYHALKYLAPLLALWILVTARKRIAFSPGWILTGLFWLVVLLINLQPFSNARALGVATGGDWVVHFYRVISTYLSYFSPWVLTEGDWQPRNNLTGIANVFIWQLVLVGVGIWSLLSKKKKTGSQWGLVILLLLSPLPAALTIDPFHAIRALVMTVPLAILAGLGLVRLRERFNRLVLFFALAMLAIASAVGLSEKILVQNPIESYDQWQTGYDQLVDWLTRTETKQYQEIVVDTTDEPAIYSLWQVFGRVSTAQKIPLPVGISYYQVTKWQGPTVLVLGNGQMIKLRPIYWPEDQRVKNVLYLGSHWRFDRDALRKAGAKILFEVKDPRGETKWMAVATP